MATLDENIAFGPEDEDELSDAEIEEIIQHSLDDFTDDFIFEVDDDILSEDDEDDDVEPILD